MWLLALAWCCLRLSSPQALPSPSGSQAAASGLCPDQCILKANGNNVMSDGAPEVPEHLQAFRSHWEEALGPYQWAYQTHKDVQESREAHREDPNDKGAGEEHQPNSGLWTADSPEQRREDHIPLRVLPPATPSWRALARGPPAARRCPHPAGSPRGLLWLSPELHVQHPALHQHHACRLLEVPTCCGWGLPKPRSQ
nr:uncharacterized protein LOC116149645 isoform X1 [Camelus dromedarius]